MVEILHIEDYQKPKLWPKLVVAAIVVGMLAAGGEYVLNHSEVPQLPH